MHAWGACEPGSIPGIPTRLNITMKFKNILILLGTIVLGGFLIYILYVGKNALTDTTLKYSQINPFPKSPQEASYQIEGNEMQFIEGKSELDVEGIHVIAQILNEPVYGDVNSDGEDDAVFLLTYTKNDSSSSYYIALALRDAGGFLGLNAVPIHNQYVPKEISIRDEIIVVSYEVPVQNEKDAEDVPKYDTLYEYLTLTGVTLQPISSLEENDEIDRGFFVYTKESQTFTSCRSATRYQISPDSRARAVLEAIYIERTRYTETDTAEVYVVLAGHTAGDSEDAENVDELEQDEEASSTEVSEIENEGTATGDISVSGNEFTVQTVLSAPKNGSCTVE